MSEDPERRDLSDLADHDPSVRSDEPVTVQQPPGPPGASPKTRRRWTVRRAAYWVGVLLALGAIGTGGYLGLTAYRAEAAAETVVQRYFEALAAGDAEAALAYGDVPDYPTALLTAEVLRTQLDIAPMRELEIVQVDESPTTATAEVTYTLGFASGDALIDDTVQLVRDGPTWRLREVAVPTVMRVVNARNRALLAGADVVDSPHLVFPGALPITFDTDHITLDDDSRVVRFARGGDIEETAQLSEAGRAAVGEALDTALGSCLDGSADALTLCPLPPDIRAVPGSLRGDLVEPASAVASIELQAGNDGLVRITGEIEIDGTYDQLDFNNQRAVEDGTHTVELLAVCYATNPEMITWRIG